MIKDPFAVIPNDPFAGRGKVCTITITQYEGGPPNLLLSCEPPRMAWMTIVALLHDATTIALQYLMRAVKATSETSGISLAKVDDDKAFRNGN